MGDSNRGWERRWEGERLGERQWWQVIRRVIAKWGGDIYIYKVVAFVCVCVSVCTTLLQPTPLDRS